MCSISNCSCCSLGSVAAGEGGIKVFVGGSVVSWGLDWDALRVGRVSIEMGGVGKVKNEGGGWAIILTNIEVNLFERHFFAWWKWTLIGVQFCRFSFYPYVRLGSRRGPKNMWSEVGPDRCQVSPAADSITTSYATGSA